MREICSFSGMSIKMLWEDHLPKHVHIYIGVSSIRMTFDGKILSGKLEPDKYKQLIKWLKKRNKELNDRWEKAEAKQPLERIDP